MNWCCDDLHPKTEGRIQNSSTVAHPDLVQTTRRDSSSGTDNLCLEHDQIAIELASLVKA